MRLSSSSFFDWLSNPHSRTVLRMLGFLAFIVIGYFAVYRAAWSPTERTDYTVYLAAGQAIWDGNNIYQVQSARGWNYVYPPPFAVVLSILAVIPKTVGAIIWYLLSVFSIVAGIEMSVRMLEKATERTYDRYYFYSSVLLILSVILAGGTMRSQASEFMIVLVIGAFYFYFNQRLKWSALCLSSAIVLKVFPFSLLIYFAIRRQWKYILYVFIFLFLLGLVFPSVFLGIDRNLAYIRDWFAVVAGPVLQSNDTRTDSMLFSQLLDTIKPRNQSIEAFLLTLHMPAAYTKYAVAVIASIMLVALWRMLMRSTSALQELLLCSAFVIWQLLIPPISEGHYFGMLIMPIVILLGFFWSVLDGADPVKVQSYRLYKNILIYGMLLTMLCMNFKVMERLRPLFLMSSLLFIFCLYFVARLGKEKQV